MRKMLLGTTLALALTGAAFTAFGGPSWLDATGLRGEDRLVASRLAAYWQARMEGNPEAMVEYVHPLQESVPENGLLVTEGYEIHDVAVDGDTAIASLTVKSRLKHPLLSHRERVVEMKSRWVKYEGKWYTAPAPTNVVDAIKAQQGLWTPPAAAPVTDDATSVQ